MSEQSTNTPQEKSFGFHTRSVHAGSRPDPTTGARALPIYQTTSYVFESPEAAAAYFNLQEYGNTYSRIMNPTVAAFEERMAKLDGGAGAVAFASGLAAQSATFFTMLNPGDHVIASAALYGGSVTQLKHLFRKLSVELDFVDPDNLDAWRGALRENTKLFFAETIGNPGGNVLDIEAVADIAHAHATPLMVDNTFATPYLNRPLEWGADIVVYVLRGRASRENWNVVTTIQVNPRDFRANAEAPEMIHAPLLDIGRRQSLGNIETKGHASTLRRIFNFWPPLLCPFDRLTA